MALQTTYSETLSAFVEGMIPDQRNPAQDRSLNVETAAGIGFGKAVGQGTGDRQIDLIATGAATAFLGVTVLDNTQLQDSYPQYATARVRTKGPIVVTAAVAVAAGDTAYVVPGDGTFTNAPAAGANLEIGKFETSAAAASLAVLNHTRA